MDKCYISLYLKSEKDKKCLYKRLKLLLFIIIIIIVIINIYYYHYYHLNKLVMRAFFMCNYVFNITVRL